MIDVQIVIIAVVISVLVAAIMMAWQYFRLRADYQRITQDAEQAIRNITERNDQASAMTLQNVIETIDYHRDPGNETPTDDLVDRIKKEQEDGRSAIGQKRKRDRYEVVRV
jgi:type II secretory pathway pseudopilin PulG